MVSIPEKKVSLTENLFLQDLIQSSWGKLFNLEGLKDMRCYFLVWGTQGSIRRHVKIVSVYAVITTESADKGVGKLIIANSDGMSPRHVLNTS